MRKGPCAEYWDEGCGWGVTPGKGGTIHEGWACVQYR